MSSDSLKRATRFFAILLTGLILPCGANATDSLSVAPSVAPQSNEFGFHFFKETLKVEAQEKNLILSPISVHLALDMALNGTARSTQDQLLRVMGYEGLSRVDLDAMQVDNINQRDATLMTKLIHEPLTADERTRLKPWEAPPAVLTLHNSAWTTNGATDHHPYNFLKNYQQRLSRFYRVDHTNSLDFKDSASAEVINDWTNKATNGMIPKIIDGNSLNGLLWILLNTTYLEANWRTPFGKPNTGEFKTSDGQAVSAPMMALNSTIGYLDTGTVQVAELELTKSSLRAFVILPARAEDFLTLQLSDSGIWSSSFWRDVQGRIRPAYGRLQMPKFSFEYGVTMTGEDAVSKALGLDFLFRNSADFSNMDDPSSPPSKVGLIKQNSKIEWDENGVKAAAATAIGGVGHSSILQPEFTMLVNRPFYFAIYDQDTNAFLFLGQVVDPNK